ncbi:MAG: caspase family protein [Acidobacteria bacterium]|nr:caspase family protein [Acidobacteriota bacterium]
MSGTARALRLVLAALVLALPRAAAAQERFALVVSGATGGEVYASQYAGWIDRFTRTLTGRLKFDPARVTVLSESGNPQAAATADNVRKAIASVRQRMKGEDQLIILLVGHGTFDGTDAKFNLVGPDLESAAWAALLQPLPGRVVIVNSTAGSFPFIERLSGPRRIVITATDSVAQRFDTVFAEYFVKAFETDSADLDKNGRISVWEAFAWGAASVRRHYQQRGQLSTERPLLDDNGDARGQSAVEQGGDGAQASQTYLDISVPGAAPTDHELLRLLQRKALLEGELEELKIRRAFLPSVEYTREFERIITDFARVSSEIRKRGGT